MKKLILVSLLIVGLLLSMIGGWVFIQTLDKAQGHAPDQILVKFLPSTPEKVKSDVHGRHDGRVVDVIPGIGVQVVKIPKNKVEEKVRAYKGEASVEFAEPDYVAKVIPTPNDPYFETQGNMDKIYYSWVTRSIIWAADYGATVINLRLGGISPSDTLKNAVVYAWSKGSVLVAAAGNNNSDALPYPAYYVRELYYGRGY